MLDRNNVQFDFLLTSNKKGVYEETIEKFELLLGDNLQGRKDYIAENGYKYIDPTDLS